MFEKTGNLQKFCTITIFIRLLYLGTFTADVGLLTTIDTMIKYHFMVELEIQIFNLFQSDNLQLQITIRFCRRQTNVVDCRNYTVGNAF